MREWGTGSPELSGNRWGFAGGFVEWESRGRRGFAARAGRGSFPWKAGGRGVLPRAEWLGNSERIGKGPRRGAVREFGTVAWLGNSVRRGRRNSESVVGFRNVVVEIPVRQWGTGSPECSGAGVPGTSGIRWMGGHGSFSWNVGGRGAPQRAGWLKKRGARVWARLW